MVCWINEALFCFRGVFSRSSTWLLFCLVVFGFLGSDEMIGISSFCRYWGLGENGYHSLLHFFSFKSLESECTSTPLGLLCPVPERGSQSWGTCRHPG